MLGMLAAAVGRSRRVPRKGFKQLTSKQGPRNFYKGKGAAPTGVHTNKGEERGRRAGGAREGRRALPRIRAHWSPSAPPACSNACGWCLLQAATRYRSTSCRSIWSLTSPTFR